MDARRGSRRGFNPLHCGAVVASPQPRATSCSGSRFNPLHCGAVVASVVDLTLDFDAHVSIPFIAGQWSLRRRPARRREDPRQVSIPFIAGQWSLHRAALRDQIAQIVFQSPSLRGSGRFSWRRCRTTGGTPCFNTLHCGAVVASRTPRRASKPGECSFNPLHCGAVVASGGTGGGGAAAAHRFQSPSLRGSGRFLLALASQP